MNPQNIPGVNPTSAQPGIVPAPGQVPMPPVGQPSIPQPPVMPQQPQPVTPQPTIPPVGMQPNSIPTQYTQPQFNQPQPAQQPIPQQRNMQTSGVQMVTPPAPEGQQSVNSNSTTPQIVENPISTQSALLISELRDGIVIMKDGSFRAVIACQSINFDLMSEQEREGVEYSYQNFLNSLNFTIQILVRSQRVDIGPYIERLSTIRRNNDNMLLGVLMDDYINFIDILSQEANIMDKAFFIVIPYFSSADGEALVNQTKNLFKTFGKKGSGSVTRINRDTYNKAVDELNNRVESVISGLFNLNIHSVRLNTRELGELYYNFNNPDTAVREPLVDFTKLATTYVRKGEGENPNVQER